MIKILNCKSKNYKKKLIDFLEIRRSSKSVDTLMVSKILKDIKKNKLQAVKKYEKRFSKNNKINVSKKEINQSIRKLDPKIKQAIDFAYSRILKFHSLQKPKNIKYVDKYKNKIEYKYIPIEKIGLYCPSNLPSSMLMTGTLAKIAKVKRIVVTTPRYKGKLNPGVMYAAKKCGVSEVKTCGGIQAIGYLTYIEKVNKIIGPGSDYVVAAKKYVSGTVAKESMEAGPSEILVLADNKTNINEISTSLVSQSEHGYESQSILVTKHKEIIDKVQKKIVLNLKKLPRKKIATQSLKKHGLIILCQNDKQITDVINEVSPEHIEVNVSNYKKYISNITNAGSVCVGRYTPMVATDYGLSMTNHVLPTKGSAKFSSGLSLDEYYKKISYVKLSKKFVAKTGKFGIRLGNFEGLTGHSESIKSRMGRK